MYLKEINVIFSIEVRQTLDIFLDKGFIFEKTDWAFSMCSGLYFGFYVECGDWVTFRGWKQPQIYAPENI